MYSACPPANAAPGRGLQARISDSAVCRPSSSPAQARRSAGRIERLQEGEDPLDVRLGHGQVGAQAARDLRHRLDEVAVVVQRVDQRLADPHLARVEAAHLELPDQVLVQVALALVAELERAVIVVLGAAIAGGRGGLGPRILHLDHDLVARRGLLVVLALRRGRVDRGEVERLLVLLGLEHHVALERLEHLGLELEHGQLQQPDGLLELRRHRQLLTELELQGRLEHRCAGLGGGGPSVVRA
jgi:hypothetical protein